MIDSRSMAIYPHKVYIISYTQFLAFSTDLTISKPSFRENSTLFIQPLLFTFSKILAAIKLSCADDQLHADIEPALGRACIACA